MTDRPNILFLMTDQMQGRVLEADHPCICPTFRRLAQRGVRIRRAYTPNPVCSPARASLMTGLLPHSHGVTSVTHCVDDDQAVLRSNRRHWAQSLADAGYRTGYFGKWHVERSNNLAPFGWQTQASSGDPAWSAAVERWRHEATETFLSYYIEGPEGFRRHRFYEVNDRPPAGRSLGVATALGLEYLDEVLGGSDPWCCFVSVIEPHDPFVVSREAFDRYDVESIELPENFRDDLAGRPGLYRKGARVFDAMTDQQKREAMACYWAMITEIDQQFARLIARVEAVGQLDNTIIVLTSDHGEMLGAHGTYQKNVGAFEEAYHIPMVLAGPGIAKGSVADARVGLHDLAPTLCELAGTDWQDTGESRSFANLLRDPAAESAHWTTGYAEYFGTRHQFSQRVIWDGDWKLVWNGFDFDELYNLAEDPGELHNRMDDPACEPVIRRLMAQAWRICKETGDQSLVGTQYPSLRLASFGPGIA